MEPFSSDLLKGKVVLVTGGGTGLGRAMGEKFARLGARLAIAGRREEVLKKTAAELTANGFDVFYKSCDVRDPAQISALMDAVEERFGGLDVLVNNAAGNFISRRSACLRVPSTRCWASCFTVPSMRRLKQENAGLRATVRAPC
ncbi:putative 2,4-dienoyl-CoA reductase [Paenibacillus sp. P1XP2]|nr:putative 2,4-dienoyl-CoA reductase [Paenibacillus sp. P1XP2]